MNFLNRIEKGPVIFDGAMGTQIQNLDLSDADWDNKPGCSEILNLTIPDTIEEIHRRYLEAGADVIETNSFGGNRVVLAEYGLEDRIIEINRAAAQIARKAADEYFSPEKPRYVAGSMGPGTRLPSLGQISFEKLYSSYRIQARGLIEGGADLLIIETCQDLLQIKAALIAVIDQRSEMGTDTPVGVSVTIETTGTLLIGSSIGAVIAALSPFPLAFLGLNCATGPDKMRSYIHEASRLFPGPIFVMPNAGMPENRGGQTVYTLQPADFARPLAEMVRDEGAAIIGGCCGTNPLYISQLSEQIAAVRPPARTIHPLEAVSSLFSAKELTQEPAPFLIGERTNTNGSRLFRDKLLKEDWDGILDIAREQVSSGAHALDLCVAYTGRDEIRDMKEALSRIVTQVDLPLVIDSTSPEVLEAALQMIGGKSIINSINLEDGEERARRICRLAKRYGSALIALTIDEKGMAKEASRKEEVARRIYRIAVEEEGIPAGDLLFDTLTFTLGSGDESLKAAGIETLEGIGRVKAACPGSRTVLGVSNISFGLSPYSREVLNSLFLDEAIKAGLDAAIVNVRKIMPLSSIPEDEKEQALDLIFNRGKDPLFGFIRFFEGKEGIEKEEIDDSRGTINDRLSRKVIGGSKSGIEGLLQELMLETPPTDIINSILIPAMKEVGQLFGAGKMQLPFVLQSAEVMKKSVSFLEPFMERTEAQASLQIVLATVKGDVHDIGKNLVDIILSNNGYVVHNLGIKCEIETIIQKLEETGAQAVGLSGLLVKSTAIMKEYLEELERRRIRVPVLLGGAALTREYVALDCASALSAPVVYCPDAFAGLAAMNFLKEGSLSSTTAAKKTIKPQPMTSAARHQAPPKMIPVPPAPFYGSRIVKDLPLREIYPLLTEQVLFRGRWGYRRGSLTADEYKELLQTEVRPVFEALKESGIKEGLFDPKVVYGYYPCHSDGNDVVMLHPDTGKEQGRFSFPRQKEAPHLCIADYFRPSGREPDLIALQVVTIGENAHKKSQELYASDAYKEYLLFHGLSVELAEALAEYWHRQVRLELGIAGEDGSGIESFVVQEYRGSRYSFGYPACPDMKGNEVIFDLLTPDRIGVTLSEEGQMVPEQTTSAFIVHHPEAKYFKV
jgi:5-methyltetrahydrofolate--homocysteine methyltransferase